MNHSTKRTLIGQLERNADLYNSMTRVVQENNIRIGRLTGIGAVQKAKLAYYDQKLMKYNEIEVSEPMEILALNGNISLKDDKPFVHAHVVLGDEKGNARGGHLLPGGTPIFACEVTIEEYDGPVLERGIDKGTGLTLWPKERTL